MEHQTECLGNKEEQTESTAIVIWPLANYILLFCVVCKRKEIWAKVWKRVTGVDYKGSNITRYPFPF